MMEAKRSVWYAASEGDKDTLIRLLENDTPVEECKVTNLNESWTPLMIAAKTGFAECWRVLSKHRVDINRADGESRSTPLMIAAENGHAECVRVLIAHGAKTDAEDIYGETVFTYAARGGHAECLRILLGHSKNCCLNVEPFLHRAVQSAAQSGHAECLRVLLDFGISDGEINDCASTAIIYAAFSGSAECLRLLIEQDAHINRTDDDGWTALICAASHGHAECLRILIHHGADVHAADASRCTALIHAAGHGHAECLRLLIEQDANVDHPECEGWTALICAASNGDTHCLRMLIGRDANVDLTDHDGWTALIHAAVHGHAECLRILVEHGATVEIADSSGCTALLYAAQGGQVECLFILLERGADVRATDSSGWTALFHAAVRADEAFSFELLQSEARAIDVSLASWGGCSAPSISAERRNDAVVRLLVAHGVAASGVRKDGCNALHVLTSNISHVFSQLVYHRESFDPLRLETWRFLRAAALFMRHGIPIDDLDRDGNVPLDLAISCSYSDRVCIGGFMSDYDKSLRIHHDWQKIKMSMFELLVQCGADINRHAEKRGKHTSLMNLLLHSIYHARILAANEWPFYEPDASLPADIESVVVLYAGRLSRSHITRLLMELADCELQVDLAASERQLSDSEG